jgi:hypothetical protein
MERRETIIKAEEEPPRRQDAKEKRQGMRAACGARKPAKRRASSLAFFLGALASWRFKIQLAAG